MRTNRSCRILGLVAAAAALSAGTRADEPSSQEILAASGVKGGLVVHLGCGDGKLTAGLRAGDGFVVHGLDRDEANVSRAREHVRSLGIYGPVSIALLEGNRLPYADDLVTLVVAGDLGGIAMDEVTRVLRPLGTAYVREGGRWNKTVKPWPDDIGEWSHFLGDASNNAVAKDTRAGPPRRLQWTAGPPWCRSHEFISSFCAMVTAGARVYYVMDLGQPGVTNRMSERWTLFARDAFNGVLLWQKPLPEWRGDEWKGTSMRGRPPSIPRRIVAGRDRLYATLSHKAGVSVIDPDTGKILREIPGTEGTQEIALAEGALVLRLAGSGEDDAALAAFDAQSGARRWQVPEKQYRGQSMAAAQGLVAYDTGRETVCLDLADGKELWRSGNDGKQAGKKGSSEQTLIVHDGLVLDNEGSRIVAREARTGKVRWDVKTGGGAMRPYDFFVIGGLAWHADSGGIAGYDLKTGKTEKTIDPTSVHSRGHHLRCYGSKATERYLITPFRGTEFVSLAGDGHSQNDWTRGPCRYGVMPANGMLYVPPHQCFCYPGSMMNGFNTYGTAADGDLRAIGSRPAPGRLRRGPAFADIPAEEPGPADWPMYRHDARRTGFGAGGVPPQVREAWQVKLGAALTPPVVAGGRLYVAAKDRHAIHAFKAADGAPLWSFTADGPVDSAPTTHGGRVLFGSADGWVYCLRASDGALAWRFRAAPEERLVVDESRLESAWRVHGSVLVHDGVAYCTAGRSSFIDGGLFLYGLKPETGEVVHEGRLHTLMATREDAKEKPFNTAFHIEGVRSDLLVAEGGRIFLNPIRLTSELKEEETPYVPHAPEDKAPAGLDVSGKPYVQENPYLSKGFNQAAALGVSRGHLGDRKVGLHLITTGGFLEDSWWNRTFWMYGETWPGYQMGHIAPKAGQILVIGDSATYAVQAYPTRNIHSPMFNPGEKGYLLTADANDNEPVLDYRSWSRDKGMGFTRQAPPLWHQWVPVRMRALVLAGETLFAAGPPDVLDAQDPMASFEGKLGALLLSFSAKDGRKLSEIKLDAEPVFDGLIAAEGRLYVSLRDGRLMCLK